MAEHQYRGPTARIGYWRRWVQVRNQVRVEKQGQFEVKDTDTVYLTDLRPAVPPILQITAAVYTPCVV